jgi:hypothetical protein
MAGETQSTPEDILIPLSPDTLHFTLPMGPKTKVVIQFRGKEFEIWTMPVVERIAFSRYLSGQVAKRWHFRIQANQIPFDVKVLKYGEIIQLLENEEEEEEEEEKSGVGSEDSDDLGWLYKAGIRYPGDDEEPDDPVDAEINLLPMYGYCEWAKEYQGRYKALPQSVFIQPTKVLSRVWDEVEAKLRVSREHFALVHQNHYLPQEGEWSHEIQWVETRGRGRAGRAKKAKIKTTKVVRLSPTWEDEVGICCTIPDLGEEGTFIGNDSTELALQVQSKFGNEDPILFYEFDQERYAIPWNSCLYSRKVIITSQRFLQGFGAYNKARGVRIKEDGEVTERQIGVLPGQSTDIIQEIQRLSDLKVRTIWRGLDELDREELIIGETLDVAYENLNQRVTIHFDAVSEYGELESITTLVRPLPTLLGLLRATYGLDERIDLALQDTSGRLLPHNFQWAGATVVLVGIKHREKKVGIVFPGETEADPSPSSYGKPIREYVESQVENLI